MSCGTGTIMNRVATCDSGMKMFSGQWPVAMSSLGEEERQPSIIRGSVVAVFLIIASIAAVMITFNDDDERKTQTTNEHER